MPQLVGPLMRSQSICNFARLCISAEFAHLRAGESAPITDRLRNLARRIALEHGQTHIGAIGMCLTGAFVIPLLLEPGVRAVVASQPSVPFNLKHILFGGPPGSGERQYQLNVSDAHVRHATSCVRDENKTILIQRFDADRISPRARSARLAKTFGTSASNFDTSPRRGWSWSPRMRY